jgi:hypothetical protein
LKNEHRRSGQSSPPRAELNVELGEGRVWGRTGHSKGDHPAFRDRCDRAAADGYLELALAQAQAALTKVGQIVRLDDLG